MAVSADETESGKPPAGLDKQLCLSGGGDDVKRDARKRVETAAQDPRVALCRFVKLSIVHEAAQSWDHDRGVVDQSAAERAAAQACEGIWVLYPKCSSHGSGNLSQV